MSSCKMILKKKKSEKEKGILILTQQVPGDNMHSDI